MSPKTNGSLLIHQDVSFFVSSLDNFQIEHFFEQDRIGYLFVISGKLQLNNLELEEKDSVKITGEKSIVMKSEEISELILLDLPSIFREIN